ncbi:MAG: acyltransferase family protein [Lachnospiraceae bacterium]|nr:acyltransferase family protein [Lachnospiraceae bacterium]
MILEKKGEGKKRDVVVDIIKGIGIFCMVAGHCGSPITKFVYLFHMAIFFIASGYCYKDSSSDNKNSLFGFIKRKFVMLWLPYVVWTAIYSCLHNFFLDINVYTDNPLILEQESIQHMSLIYAWSVTDIVKNIIKSFMFRGITRIGGALWFVATLMEITVLYCIIDFIIKKLIKKDKVLCVQAIFSVLFLCLGYLCSLKGISFMGIEKVLSCYILFYGGYVLKKKNVYIKERESYFHIAVLTICFAILLVLNRFGSVSLNINSYENPLFFMFASFVGWQFLYEIAFLVKRIDILKRSLVCMGQNTMSIVIFHFLCFKIVSYIGVVIKGQSRFLVAAHPVLYRDGYWWMAYMFVGLVIPIMLSVMWKNVKEKIVSICTN